MSWISLQDVVGIIEHVAFTETLSGGINVTAPASCTNLEFTKTFGRVLHRPTLLPAPVTALRLALGEMADALLLANCRVSPQKLIASGYAFELPTLEDALRFECGCGFRAMKV
jgi:NAD dependent epimerase/dehydratase family enzyme